MVYSVKSKFDRLNQEIKKLDTKLKGTAFKFFDIFCFFRAMHKSQKFEKKNLEIDRRQKFEKKNLEIDRRQKFEKEKS